MITTSLIGLVLGVGLAALLTFLFGVYTIGPTQRGVIATFGRAQRIAGTTADDPMLGALLTDEEKLRYCYPNIRVIPPGGPYFKGPWQRLHLLDTLPAAAGGRHVVLQVTSNVKLNPLHF